MQEQLGEQAGGTTFDPDAAGSFNPVPPPAPDLGRGEQLGAGPTRIAPVPPRPQRALLDYLLGP